MRNWKDSFSGVVIFLCLSFAGKGQDATAIRIDTGRVYQVIDNFGASDAWSCQFIGGWPEAKKNEMADWLFSMDTAKDGRPKGIGLSLWRFNIGAGSAEQAAASGIRDEWRRAADMLNGGSAGQLWFLGAARQRGVRQFLGFLNSPPVGLTRNGKAYAATAGQSNIDPSRYHAFAAYTVNVVKHIRKAAGIDLDYLSPVNEPQWDWSDGGQEGCPYSDEEVYGVVKALSGAFRSGGVHTRILIPEAGHLKYLLTDGDKPGKGNQIDAFFRKSSPFFVGGLYNVSKIAAGHSYFSTSPLQAGIELRRKLAVQIGTQGVGGLRYWQSEYCILGDNDGEINGNKRDTGMDAALYLARVIHTDLVEGRAAAWQWWLAISPYDYKDGLIYVDRQKEDGNYYDSKKLWALGNFSRFVRPGMRRVEVTLRGGTDSLLASAYKDGMSKVVVFVNCSQADRVVDGGLYGTMYTTSTTENLQKHVISWGEKVVVPARSVSTLVMKGS
jgi:O-glycosyl hydrolase